MLINQERAVKEKNVEASSSGEKKYYLVTALAREALFPDACEAEANIGGLSISMGTRFG